MENYAMSQHFAVYLSENKHTSTNLSK